MFLCCTENRVGRSKLSSAIDLELFEQGRTFDPRTQAIFTYSQPSEYICSIMASKQYSKPLFSFTKYHFFEARHNLLVIPDDFT